MLKHIRECKRAAETEGFRWVGYTSGGSDHIRVTLQFKDGRQAVLTIPCSPRVPGATHRYFIQSARRESRLHYQQASA